jgi:YHS domain-containing protein
MDDQANASLTAAVYVDPVCGMRVDPAASPPSSERGGRTIWFCCAGCKKAFDRRPGLYEGGD